MNYHADRRAAPDRTLGGELLAVMCRSGPAAEELICGPIDDGSDRIDQQMARRYLRDCFADGQIEQQLVRKRLAVERLVSSSRRQIEIHRRCIAAPRHADR